MNVFARWTAWLLPVVVVLVLGACNSSGSLATVEAQARSSASQPTVTVAAGAEATPVALGSQQATPTSALPTPTPVFVPMDLAGSTDADEPMITIESLPAATPAGETKTGDVSGSNFGSSVTHSRILDSVGNVRVDDLVIRVGAIDYNRIVTFRAGRDTDERFLTVEVEFDRLHTLEPWDFRIMDHLGNEYRPNAGEMVPQGGGSLRFAIDDEVNTTSGWLMRVSTSSDTAEVDL